MAILTKEQILEVSIGHHFPENDDWGYGWSKINESFIENYGDSNKFFYAKKVTTIDGECLCDADCRCEKPYMRTIETPPDCVFVYPIKEEK